MKEIYICPECETKIVRLYEEGDCSYYANLLTDHVEDTAVILDDDKKAELYDYRNVGYTWYCTDKSCNAGSEGWFGDRTERPPTEEDFKSRPEEEELDDFAHGMIGLAVERLSVDELTNKMLGYIETVESDEDFDFGDVESDEVEASQ
jgi:hypothetical protein|tara:strand:+ start:8212 stop:8655 length:444 start_codon:yes stop_codon:yes gene_type:complete